MSPRNTPPGRPRTVYLIDSSIYIFRAYFSPYQQSISKRGDDRSALMGFISFLCEFSRRANPQYVAVASDESLFSGFRHRLSADYKSNRALPDANLELQLEGCKQFCQLMGFAQYGSLEYEADDIIGFLMERFTARRQKLNCVIVSRDKDLAQLLNRDNVFMWDYPSPEWLGADSVARRWGVNPAQIPDFLALVGDPVDCIAGVPGIGSKTAVLLLHEFGGVESLIKNAYRIPALGFRGAGRCAEKLLAHRDTLLLAKELATIRRKPASNLGGRSAGRSSSLAVRESFMQANLQQIKVKGIKLQLLDNFLNKYQLQDADAEKIKSKVHRLQSLPASESL
jgi:5'-3' exonuclease